QTSSSPDQLSIWYRENYNLDVVPPAGLDYNALRFYDLGDFQGKRVPVLLFIRETANARVYILSPNESDLRIVVEAPGYKVKYFHHPTEESVAYVAVYSSDNFDSFMEKQAVAQLEMGPSANAGEGTQ